MFLSFIYCFSRTIVLRNSTNSYMLLKVFPRIDLCASPFNLLRIARTKAISCVGAIMLSVSSQPSTKYTKAMFFSSKFGTAFNASLIEKCKRLPSVFSVTSFLNLNFVIVEVVELFAVVPLALFLSRLYPFLLYWLSFRPWYLIPLSLGNTGCSPVMLHLSFSYTHFSHCCHCFFFARSIPPLSKFMSRNDKDLKFKCPFLGQYIEVINLSGIGLIYVLKLY